MSPLMVAKKKKIHRVKKCRLPRNSSEQGFYIPFKDLDQHFGRKSSAADPAKHTTAKNTLLPRTVSEDELFLQAMRDVVPLAKKSPGRIPPSPPTQNFPRFLLQEEREVYAQLAELVAGDGPFELNCSDEYMDGAILGLSPEILKKLRNGDFSYQDSLDLHGLNRQQALELVTQFIYEGFSRKFRCVLIVCGRGLNSENKEPVLKQHLVGWLTRSPLKRVILAFASARSWDGGAGAFYVLLRRNRGKAPFICPAP